MCFCSAGDDSDGDFGDDTWPGVLDDEDCDNHLSESGNALPTKSGVSKLRLLTPTKQSSSSSNSSSTVVVE